MPFTISVSRTEKPSVLDLFMKQRRAAETSQEPEMTLDVIYAEIRAAREECFISCDRKPEALSYIIPCNQFGGAVVLSCNVVVPV